MPYANSQGMRIHYETEGQGPPLVLQYGQYWPLEIWYEHNYVTALKNDYQLILIDSRGQGESDKPDDPGAYRMELMANDVVAVLDNLSVAKAHYMGYSSGGLLGFGIARLIPERFYSLIIGGMHPYDAHLGKLEWSRAEVPKLEKQTPEDFVAGLEQYLSELNLPPLSPSMKISMLRHNPRALSAWLQKFAEWPSFEDILGTTSIPCLLYAGENDGCYAQAQKAANELPDATFVGIPGGEHLEGGTWINVLQPHLTKFITKVHPT
jgi:pimeloyl-ACP methyl ester carboxylesterase